MLLKLNNRFAVIGDPITHSLSPAMHSAAFKAAGIDANYEAQEVSPTALEDWVQRARHIPYAGFNVTIPHKERVGRYLDELDDSAQRVNAVNTVVNQGNALIGFNTDASGFVATLQSRDIDVRGRCVVVLGAGGSARAVVRGLADLGADIILCSRTLPKAEALAASLSISVTPMLASSTKAGEAVSAAHLVVNTTPLGMKHLPFSPLPPGTDLQPETTVVDLVYGPITALIRQGRVAGCVVIDGIEMLVQQGAAAFQLWTKVVPDVAIMRATCRQALREVHSCSAS